MSNPWKSKDNGHDGRRSHELRGRHEAQAISLGRYLESTAYVKLAPSTLPGAGVGVMALRSIPSGVDPFAGPNPQCRPPEVFIPLGQAEMARMPADVCAHAMSFFPAVDATSDSPVYCVPANGFAAFDASWYVNHSSDPNVRFTPPGDDDGSGFATLRPIEAEEELFMDYREAFPDLYSRMMGLRGGRTRGGGSRTGLRDGALDGALEDGEG